MFSLKRINMEWKSRSLKHFLRFLLQLEREKRTYYVDKYLSWYNKQIFISHCNIVGTGLQVGPKEMVLKVRGNVSLELGNNVNIFTPIHISLTSYFCQDSKLEIGDGTHIGPYTAIRVAKNIKIGRNCLIARWVRIFDHSGHPLDPDMRLARKKIPGNEIRPVIIGDNVWIGEDSFINAGVTIGSGSIVSANSIVTKNVPENVIVFGSPARVINWLKREKSEPE
jgi:acetyltransferase-like isoleucine patch superfamily enzyme